MQIADKIQLPVLSELEFDEESHAYAVNGVEVPSVTQLLHLLPGNDYANVPDYVLANAARRGTAVHEAIEYLMQFGIEEYDEELAPYVSAFKDFWNGLGATPIGNEVPIYYDDTDSDEAKEPYGTGYAGTLDMLAAVEDQIVLLDFKCTSKVFKKKYAIQLEAYSQALRKFGIVVDRKIVVQLKKDGKFKAYEFPAKDDYSWAIFRSLRALKNYENS